jgi:hypothetical protein
MSYYYYYEINKIELHYWLKGNSHSMDAFILNKCELEFLNISQKVASLLNIEILVQTEPLAEGGIRRFFKIMSKEESTKATITIAVVSTLIAGIITTPITSALSKTVEISIEKLLESDIDVESKKLDFEEKKLRIQKLRIEIQEKINTLQNNRKLKEQKSNFYKELLKESKIEKVSITIKDESLNSQKVIFEEHFIEKEEFKKFILPHRKF